MFGLGDFWDKQPSSFLKILILFSGNFKIFKNALGQFIPNRHLNYVIASINYKREYLQNILAIHQLNVDR